MKMNIGTWLLQIIPVMLGVYLAFVVSNWNDERKTKDELGVFREALINEIAFNKQQLEFVVDYHRMLRDTCRYYLSNNIEISSRPLFFKGTQTGRLDFSAFETGKQTGLINQLDIKKINAINNVYNQQVQYNNIANMTLQSLINKDFDDNPQSIRKIMMLLSITMEDIVVLESRLIKDYNQLLLNLKE